MTDGRSKFGRGAASQTPARVNHTLVSDRKAFRGFLIKRLGNTADAEDVLQDFCIRVLAPKDQSGWTPGSIRFCDRR